MIYGGFEECKKVGDVCEMWYNTPVITGKNEMVILWVKFLLFPSKPLESVLIKLARTVFFLWGSSGFEEQMYNILSYQKA